MKTYKTCEDCEGTGLDPNNEEQECETCKGETKILNHLEHDEY